MTKKVITILGLAFAVHFGYTQNVTTLAGQSGISGSANGSGTAATFDGPHSVVYDAAGNIYVADRDNNLIRKITAAGVVSTFAGSGTPGSTDGTGVNASFFEPWGIAIDNAGNLYVADTKNYKVRKITSAGVVTTFAGAGTAGVTDGASASAQFGFPVGVATDASGNVYVSEYMAHCIRKISGGQVTTIAGTAFQNGDAIGAGSVALFDHPHGIATDNAGNIYVADSWNNKIKKISPSHVVTTLAGSTAGFANGAAASAQFDNPSSVCVDGNGAVYVGDINNFCIRKIWNNSVSTFAGIPGTAGNADGPLLQATFNSPSGIGWHSSDKFVIGDEGNELIRVIDMNQTALPLTLSTQNNVLIFCQGTSNVITANPQGLSSYEFKDGSTVIATNTSGVLSMTSLTPGLHAITCTATGPSGNYSTTSPLNISIAGSNSASVSPAGPLALCNGSSITLTASAGASYLWSNGATTSSINVNQPGNYSVVITYQGGCTSQSNTVTITQGGTFNVSITPSGAQSVCAGDSLQLTATSGAGYHWSNGASTQSIYVNAAGSYSVTVTNNSGCSGTSSPVTVTVNSLPVATITPAGPITILQGQSAVLTANSASGYLWSTGAQTQAITVSLAGTYWVKVKNASGCYSLADSVTVIVNPLTSVTISADGDTVVCPADSVKLISSLAFGCQWFKDNVLIPGAVHQIFYAKEAGDYIVKVIVGSTTLVSNTITVVHKNVPSTIDASSDSACTGNPVTISIVPQSNVTFNWFEQMTGGTAIASGNNFTTPPLAQTKTYYVEAYANGCVSISRFAVEGYIYPLMNPSFSYDAPVRADGGIRVTFENTTPQGNYSYEWDFGDGTAVSTDINPQHTYVAEDDYMVTLKATNAFGCTEVVSKLVSVSTDHTLFLPNAFTPNSDGVNDIFRLRGSGFVSASMMILNQWGQLIFKTDNASAGWDGSSRGGLVQNGTYSYIVQIKMTDGKERVMKGNVSLIK